MKIWRKNGQKSSDDKGIDMKALFVTLHDIFGKINNGGNQCSDRNLKILQKLYGAEQVDVCIGVAGQSKVQSASNVYMVKIMSSRVAKVLAGVLQRSDLTWEAEQFIEHLVKKNYYDIIFFDNTKFGRVIKKLKTNPKLHNKIVVFAHNVEKDILWQRVINENKLCLPLYFAAKHCEALSMKYADKVLALTERDGLVFEQIYGRKMDFILPITFSDRYKESAEETIIPLRSLLFTGSDYLPNVKGIIWFCKEVMPELDIPLYIVGRGLEKLRDELECENVKVIGSVDSLAPYLKAAGAVVMPIFYGSGMKVKTAEAIMYGKRIFATSEALVGYQVAERGMTCCDDAESFRKEIKHYFHEEGIQKEFQEVRTLFKQYYDTERYLDLVKKLLEGNYESGRKSI